MSDDDTAGRGAPGLAVGWEELPWRINAPQTPMTRSERASIRSTYRAAVPARIAGLPFQIESAVAAHIDDARAEIARFDVELSALFPGVEIAPLSAVLLRTESASSSQIENITAGAKALALAEVGIVKYGSNAGIVAANVEAMRRALDLADDVTAASILAIHEVLMHGQEHACPGRFREEQVWIGGSSVSPHKAAFVPPHHSRVAEAIDDLAAFIRRTDLPLIAQAAIAHAQFETIHPFNDGNGRTGRALVHAMLKQGGATTRVTVPVSAGLLTDTEAYFTALTAYRDGDPNPIVKEFGKASFAAVRNGRTLADDLAGIYDRWAKTLTARKDAGAWKVLPLLLSRPAITSRVIQEAAGLSQPASDNAIRQLLEAGIVARASGTQRHLVWVANDVTRALDAFGVRARRYST